MPQVDDSGQQGFFDEPISNAETLSKLREQCDVYAENKEAASAYARANREIKELLPSVEHATRFLLGEDLAIEVTPQSKDGYDVGPKTIQRKKIITDFHSEP